MLALPSVRVLSLHIGFLGVSGGIASAARSIVDALAGEAAGERNEVVAHSLLGNESALHDAPLRSSAIVRGFDGNKARFVTANLGRAALFRPAWVFVDCITLLGVGFAAARLVGARVALFLHGREIYGVGSRPGAIAGRPPRLSRALARRADRIFANSPWTAELGQEALALPTRPHVSWLPVEDRKRKAIELARAAATEVRDDYVLMVSRGEAAYKGHQTLIDLVASGAISQRLVIAGVGARKRELDLAVAARGASERVTIIDFASEEDLARLYVGAFAFVMLSSGEGLGLVYLEALSARVPAIGLSPGPIEDLKPYGARSVRSPSELPAVLRSLPPRGAPGRPSGILPPFHLGPVSEW